MFLRVFILTLAAIFLAGPALSQEANSSPDGVSEKRESVLLPAHRSGIIIHTLDEEGREIEQPYLSSSERTGKFAELYVKPRVSDDNPDEFYIPKNFDEAVKELKLMLPQNYLDFVLQNYGYIKPGKKMKDHRKFIRKFDDRILDLTVFLYTIWDMSNPDRTLSKQVGCMGIFEYSFPALFVFLVIQEMSEEGGTHTSDIGEAIFLTNHLKARCLAE